LAVCGYPKQIILDEPTAGVDPATRLFLWSMIQRIRDTGRSSIILTTHSMEEAQTLCNRLTILINGRLVCLGSPEYLRMKYARSYLFEVQTADEQKQDQQEQDQDKNQNKVHQLLFDKEIGAFPDATYKLEKLSQNRYKYQLEIKPQSQKHKQENEQEQEQEQEEIKQPPVLGQLFKVLEKAKKDGDLIDYTVSQVFFI